MSALRLYSTLMGAAVVVAFAARYWLRGHRKTAEEREFERRAQLTAKGRITDGTVLDVKELAHDGHPSMQFLIYTYVVAGVNYECSQDVTHLRDYVNLRTCRIGLPASVKYDPHNPGNSIVIAERWTGLRH